MRADKEQGKHVEGLTQLCNKLSIGTGHFDPVLVGLFNLERNLDACRKGTFTSLCVLLSTAANLCNLIMPR